MARQSLLQMIIVILMVGLVLVIAVTLQASAKRAALRTGCASNLRQIGAAMMMYAEASENRIFPTHGTVSDPFADQTPVDSLMLLYKSFVQDPRVFDCPEDPLSSIRYSNVFPPPRISSARVSFGYDPGHIAASLFTAIAADRKAIGAETEFHGDGRNVLQASGTVFFSTTTENFGQDSSGNDVLIDDDIYSLNPARKRDLDSYIRQ